MKKQTSLLLSFILLASVFKSQSWTTSGNSVGAGAFLGTTSNHALNFHTNGTKKASISTSGVFNVSGLAGTGSRFLQANSTGDLVEWTGNGGDNNKALFGDNTFKTLPFTFESTKMSVNPGVKLGVGITDPAAELDVFGDAKVSGKIVASSVMLTTNLGFNYNLATGNFRVGKKFDDPNEPSVDPCFNLPNVTFFQYSGGGFETYQVPGGGSSVNASLRAFVSPTDGNGYIESTGTNQNNQSATSLNLNTICGKNTNINTGPYGGQVNLGNYVSTGDFVKMTKHLEIGDATSGITSAPNNIALDIFANDGYGIRLKTTNTNNFNDMFSVEFPSGSGNVKTFNVTTRGKTTINCGETRAFTIKDLTGSGNPETFSIDKNGYTEINVWSTMPNGYGTSPRVLTVRDKLQNKDIFVVKADGKVYAREVEINLTTSFPDYVFEKNYTLTSIPDLANYVKSKKHLPGFENAEHYEKNGINVNAMIVKQQEKIEELTLYIIQLEERIRSIESSK